MRALRMIAAEIMRDPNWKAPMGASPYLEAMCGLDRLGDVYGTESADDIVLRFLTNATHYRGETARRIKIELNAMLHDYEQNRAAHAELAKRQRSAMPGKARPLPAGWYDQFGRDEVADAMYPKGWDKVD